MEKKELTDEEILEFHEDDTICEANRFADQIIKSMEYCEFDRKALVGYIVDAIDNSVIKINQP